MVKALSVKQFNEYFKTNIKHDPILSRTYVKGDLANIRFNNSHLYFSLKEDNDIIDCVIYYYNDKDIHFDFSEGIEVLVRGNLSYNNYSSRIVIVVSDIEEVGLSEQYRKFLKIKENFKNRGYFDAENKKPIPTFPKNVGLITSKDGAAIVDFISVINQKPNDINIKLYPVKVQGSESIKLIITAIEKLDQLNLDVIVITRGGGSNEDLSTFNDKDIVETVYKLKTPVISAIGHKIDNSLLDLVADLSLQTPTEAGSYVVANYSNLERDLHKIIVNMQDIILNQIRINELRVGVLDNSIKASNPKKLLEDKSRDIINLKKSLDKALISNYTYNETKLAFIEKRLKLASNLINSRKQNISIKDDSGKDIFSKHSVKDGDLIEVNFSDGKVKAVITDG
ncbi:exodeoxyribonuclease VII large subunit [uncultured Anaerococcus sp.]|uniref:exodeoxyribonuclease VII large subunit n=1 Tax=uncultured Anaerococcus sp. TaxID=293428 RepID=UPI002638650A|nr:exodeoxyribonuclease VII large subunit [uncultured Anaerococcus sp.]